MASQIMRPNVPAVRPDESLARAAELMDSLGVRELPVVDGRLAGIIAERDLQPHRGHYEWTAVRAAMTVDPVTVTPETPIGTIARLLLERSFNSVPVVSEGRLLGMVCRSDILRLVAEGDGGRVALP
jgi:predicted transcriptional regulator